MIIAIALVFFEGILPPGLLVYFNYNIYKGIKNTALGQSISEQHDITQRRTNQEHVLANYLIGIVVVFISCHTLRNLLYLSVIIWFLIQIVMTDIFVCLMAGNIPLQLSAHTFLTAELGQVLLVLNSSINTLVYFWQNNDFKTHVLSSLPSSFRRTQRNHAERAISIEMQWEQEVNAEHLDRTLIILEELIFPVSKVHVFYLIKVINCAIQCLKQLSNSVSLWCWVSTLL